MKTLTEENKALRRENAALKRLLGDLQNGCTGSARNLDGIAKAQRSRAAKIAKALQPKKR